MHKGCMGLLVCLALVLVLTGETTVSESETKTVGVDGFRQLKMALESPGECVVYLKKNIELTKEIRVKGVKVLQGKGRKIYRGKNHRGNLLYVKKATLSLEEVTVEGNKKSSLRDKSAVHAGDGSMVLCKKGTIRNHTNLRGGAAVMVDAGGVFEMQGGILEKKHLRQEKCRPEKQWLWRSGGKQGKVCINQRNCKKQPGIRYAE